MRAGGPKWLVATVFGAMSLCIVYLALQIVRTMS